MSEVQFHELCQQAAELSDRDIQALKQIMQQMSYTADSGCSDVFLDVLEAGGQRAIVVAHARPATAHSLYRRNVVGDYAFPANEPGVFAVFAEGRPVIGACGVSQEGVPIRQNIVPVRGEHERVIAVMITEQDMTEWVDREMDIASLERSNHYLTELLLRETFSESTIPDLVDEAIVLVDNERRIRYMNRRVRELVMDLSPGTLSRTQAEEGIEVHLVACVQQLIHVPESGEIEDIQWGKRLIRRRVFPIFREGKTAGKVWVLQDRTEMRNKEKEILVQSATIHEIQHRIHNHLQLLSSLLRMQMRRSQIPEAQQALSESIARIEGMSVIHDTLWSRTEETMVPLGDPLKHSCEAMWRTVGTAGRKLIVEIPNNPPQLSSDRFHALCLIINELMVNAVKHATAPEGNGALRISIAAFHAEAELRWVESREAPASPMIHTQLASGNQPLTAKQMIPSETIHSEADNEHEGALEALKPSERSELLETPRLLIASQPSAESETPRYPQLGVSIINVLVREKLGGTIIRESDEGGYRVKIAFPLGG